MAWKCVLVGLALVLPGFLLHVEGRNSKGERAATDHSSILDTLKRLVEEDQELTRKRLDNNNNDNSNSNNNPHSNSQTGAGNKNPDPQESPPVPDSPDSNEGDEEEEEEAGPPLALAISQAAGQSHDRERIANGAADGLSSNMVFVMIVAGCSVLAAVGIIGAGVCWYKYHKSAKAASDVEYPAYGVTGPTKDRLPSPGDRKLAQSAQMYHYQHQKQQMIAMEKANGDMKHDASDEESEEDTAEGDYTVYECPGLAPTGEMEVKNPLFRGDETPSTPAPHDDDQTPPGTD